jgi:ABC-2 type transport system permease protein
MTGSAVSPTVASRPFGTLAGFGPLVRKERTEWIRGRRAWVVAVVVTLFMTLQAVAAWVNDTLRRAFPSPDAVLTAPASLDPVDNLLLAVSAQAYLFVAIFALAGLLIREREDGTLAWVASKPVTRAAILMAKWVNAGIMLVLLAVAVPLAVSTGLVAAAYGPPDPAAVLAIGLGMAGVVVFFAAAAVALATVVSSVPAVAGLLFGLLFLPALVSVIPLPVAQFLPHAILPWAVGAATGSDVGFVAPIAWLLWTMAAVVVGIRRLERLEL